MVTHDFLLGDEERFWPLRFTVFILAVLLYVFNRFQRIIVGFQLANIVFIIPRRIHVIVHGLLRITIFVRYVFLGALNNLVLVKSLDLRVELTTLLRLILIDGLYTYLKGLVNFLFLAPYRACGVHRPRCIYIAFLHLVLVDVVD